MPTERLLIFDELGNAKRVKARLTRFLENEPVTNTEKSAMRDTLGITGTSGDLISSNNLSDVASKDTTKLNLEVPDIGLQANQVPLCGMLNSGAWLDFDAFYETGTWTPSITFGGGSTGITYSSQEGYYTRVGNLAVVTGHIKMSANGSSNGTARIAGLPITGKNMSSASVGASAVVAGYMSGLTSGVTAQVDDNATTATLYDHSATGYAELDHNNLTGATSLRFTITYPIQ